MSGGKWKRALLSVPEGASWIPVFAGAIKVALDLPVVTGLNILEPPARRRQNARSPGLAARLRQPSETVAFRAKMVREQMTRVWTVGALVAFAAVTLSADAQGPTYGEASAKRLVQGFYDWYVPRALKGDAVGLALSSKASAFAPRLSKALKEDQAATAQSPGEIVGLDFDPFLDTLGGSVRSKGTRVPLRALLDTLDAGYGLDYFLDGWPDVTAEDAKPSFDGVLLTDRGRPWPKEAPSARLARRRRVH
jgi:hypothetical protein